ARPGIGAADRGAAAARGARGASRAGARRARELRRRRRPRVVDPGRARRDRGSQGGGARVRREAPAALRRLMSGSPHDTGRGEAAPVAPADRTLPAFLAAAAERWGDREAVVWGDVRWTYRDLAREAARVADGLRALGVGKGDPVGVLLPNWPEFFATVFGATALGAVAVCLNTMATEPELAFALDHARVRWLVYTPAFLRHDYERSLASFGVDRAPAERSAARDLVARVALVRAGEVPDGARDYRSLGSSPADGAARLRELD